ncbi:MAG: rhodanese-like domain-containing protein [Pseudomonadota bacterium]
MAKISRRAVLGGGGAALALIGVGTVYGVTTLGATAAELTMTPPDVLAAVREGRVLLVDIRRPDEWADTGIPEGAVPIDLRRDDFTDAVIAVRAFEGQPVAVICARGVRSRRMTVRLDEAGIAPIVDIPEGMLGSFAGPGWLQRGLPVVTWNA